MAYQTLTIQLTSLVAFIASFMALIMLWRAARRFSPGFIKKSTNFLFIKLLLLSFATLNLTLYHFFNINKTVDLWHIFAGLSMLAGSLTAVYVAVISRKLS